MQCGDGGEVGCNGCVAAGFCWGEFGAYRYPLGKVFVSVAFPVFAVVVLAECCDELGLQDVDMGCEDTNAIIQNALIIWPIIWPSICWLVVV
ncbi:unannotated protein [freshwater metagenome]|uniref:Unannotated protein n=1 Tax=freshwater metagenome TaxID=449393 RepID=A0A6J7UX45_9ZZZZ